MTIPGAGEEKMRPKLWGAVTEWRCNAQAEVSAVLHGQACPSISLSGAGMGDQLLPAFRIAVKKFVFQNMRDRPSSKVM